jgi:hypothetical protein
MRGSIAGVDTFLAGGVVAVDRIIVDIGIEIDLVFVANRIDLQESGDGDRRKRSSKDRTE